MRGKLTVLLVLLIIGGGGFVAWTEIQSKQAVIAELEAKNAALTKETEGLKKQAADAEAAKGEATALLQDLQKTNCKGIWSDERGCEEPPKVFSYPVGEETLCFGKTVDVKWDATLVTAESVDIMLATSSNSAKLATLKNTGSYKWKLETPHKTIGDNSSFTIAAGLYKMRIQSPEGNLVGKDTELFDIKKCNDKSAAPAPAKKSKLPARKKK